MPIGLGLLFVPAVIAALVIYDRIIDIEATRYPAAWQQDGQPNRVFRSYRGPNRDNRSSPFLSWLFKTPSWARDDQQLRRLFLIFRILVIIWNIGIGSIFISQFLFGELVQR
jgi:hypothetical protein